MYYEIYIDVLFLVNFMMDTLVLLLVGKLLKRSFLYRNVALGAVAGAALYCVLLVVPGVPWIIKIIPGHVLISSAMLWIAFRFREWNCFWKGMLALYSCTFLLGGILQSLSPYVKTWSFFFAAAVAAWFLARGIWTFFSGLIAREKREYTVVLYEKEKSCRLRALVDTGNCLRDPFSGQPVHIVERKAAVELLQEKSAEGIRYISFRTLQGEGILPVIRLEKMCVILSKEEKIWISRPVIGISSEHIFVSGKQQMLLNREILGGI